MEAIAVTKYVRISPFKVRDVTSLIQGKSVKEALAIVALTPRRASDLIGKTLRSAIANAEHNNQANVDQLVVKEATVGEGPTIKRFRPKARGSAGRINKRTSHIRIVVSDQK